MNGKPMTPMIGQTISLYPASRNPAQRDKILERLDSGPSSFG
jgi:hypothetical protein